MADELNITELRKLLAKATLGPWFTTCPPWFDVGSGVMARNADPHVGFMIADCEAWEGEREEYLANDGRVKLAHPDDDAAFIVAAHEAFPALLDAAETRDRLREENDQARAIIDHIETYYPQAVENARASLANIATEGTKP